MASILKRTQKSKPFIHQFLFLEAPVQVVSAELITWGESSWWPKDCLWKYVRQTDGEIRVGTEYVIKINKPSAQDWTAEVSQLLPNRMVERTFKKGLFKGFERIMIEERANGTRIDYELHVTISGLVNNFLWPLVLRRQYLNTINKVLAALKNHLVAESQKRSEEGNEPK